MSDFPCDAYQSALNGARATGEGDTLDRGDGNENSQAQDMSNDMRVKFQNEGAHAGGGGDELGAAGGIPSHCLEDFKCPICLDTFINTVKVDCSYGHKFCNFCIQSWINSERSIITECPVCRSPIFGKHLDLKTDADIRAVFESLPDQDKLNRLVSINDRLKMERPQDTMSAALETLNLSNSPRHLLYQNLQNLNRALLTPTAGPEESSPPFSFREPYAPMNLDDSGFLSEYPRPDPGPPHRPHFHPVHQHPQEGDFWDPYLSPPAPEMPFNTGSFEHFDMTHGQPSPRPFYFNPVASSAPSPRTPRYPVQTSGHFHAPTNSPPGYFCCCSPTCHTHHCPQPPAWHGTVPGPSFQSPPMGNQQRPLSCENNGCGAPRTPRSRPNMPGSTNSIQLPSPTTLGQQQQWTPTGYQVPRVVTQPRVRQPVLRCPIRADNAQFSGGFPVFSSGQIGFQIFHAPTTAMIGDRLMSSSPSLLTHPLVSLHPLNPDGSSARVYLTFEVHNT